MMHKYYSVVYWGSRHGEAAPALGRTVSCLIYPDKDAATNKMRELALAHPTNQFILCEAVAYAKKPETPVEIAVIGEEPATKTKPQAPAVPVPPAPREALPYPADDDGDYE